MSGKSPEDFRLTQGTLLGPLKAITSRRDVLNITMTGFQSTHANAMICPPVIPENGSDRKFNS